MAADTVTVKTGGTANAKASVTGNPVAAAAVTAAGTARPKLKPFKAAGF